MGFGGESSPLLGIRYTLRPTCKTNICSGGPRSWNSDSSEHRRREIGRRWIVQGQRKGARSITFLDRVQYQEGEHVMAIDEITDFTGHYAVPNILYQLISFLDTC